MVVVVAAGVDAAVVDADVAVVVAVAHGWGHETPWPEKGKRNGLVGDLIQMITR